MFGPCVPSVRRDRRRRDRTSRLIFDRNKRPLGSVRRHDIPVCRIDREGFARRRAGDERPGRDIWGKASIIEPAAAAFLCDAASGIIIARLLHIDDAPSIMRPSDRLDVNRRPGDDLCTAAISARAPSLSDALVTPEIGDPPTIGRPGRRQQGRETDIDDQAPGDGAVGDHLAAAIEDMRVWRAGQTDHDKRTAIAVGVGIGAAQDKCRLMPVRRNAERARLTEH